MKDSKRKRYSEAFKKEAVMRVIGQNSSTHSVSRDMGISQPICKWVKKSNLPIRGFLLEKQKERHLRY